MNLPFLNKIREWFYFNTNYINFKIRVYPNESCTPSHTTEGGGDSLLLQYVHRVQIAFEMSKFKKQKKGLKITTVKPGKGM